MVKKLTAYNFATNLRNPIYVKTGLPVGGREFDDQDKPLYREVKPRYKRIELKGGKSHWSCSDKKGVCGLFRKVFGKR